MTPRTDLSAHLESSHGPVVDASVRVSDEIAELVRREVIDPGVATTAAVAWARRRSDRWVVAYAEVVAEDVARPPIFDLASVTKPLTATVAARAIVEGRLAPSTRVRDVLPELGDTAAADAAVEALLSHRAGLPAWGVLYRSAPFESSSPRSLPPDEPLDHARMLRRAASRRDASTSISTYSDLGYVLLGAMLARVNGEPLARSWRRVTGIGAAADVPPGARARVAPTEVSAFRGVVRGEVHDENAWALERCGGDPGHAGAFATVLEVVAFAIRWADALAGRDPSPIVPQPLAEAMIAERPGGSHRLGWDGRSGDAPSSGARFGRRTFGHLGFTGTSVWIDPDEDAIAVVLTNRTWPTRENVRIRAARPRIHDALFAIEV